jgi:hypothetical protein
MRSAPEINEEDVDQDVAEDFDQDINADINQTTTPHCPTCTCKRGDGV